MCNPTAALARNRVLTAAVSLLVFSSFGAARATSAPPSVSSISPQSAYSGQAGFSLTVDGSGFSGKDRVQWNGTNVSSTTYVSPNEITGYITSALLAAPGNYSVTVTDANGDVSNSEPFAVIPSPVIAAISPSSTIAGSAQFTLTVSGANFLGNSVVIWKGAPLATSFVSTSEVQATVPAADVASAGTATVVVTSPTAPSTGNCMFTTTASPVVQILKPSTALAGSAGFSLSVAGANFTSDQQVTWNGAALQTTDISSTALSAVVPASLIVSPETAYIGAVTGSGVETAKTLPFVVQAGPSITSISPNSAIAGAPGFTMTVTGANFQGGYLVEWNGVAISTTFVSATQLSAHVSTGNIPAAGTDSVTVVTPNAIASNSALFTVTSGPVLSAVIASSCIAGSPSFTVTLNGANFPKNAVATWDQATLATTWLSPTKLTAKVSAAQVASPQTANLAVTSSSSPTTQAVAFTVGMDPILSNVVPTCALANTGKFTLTVNGGQFSSGYSVTWNGATLATSFVSASQLTATVPAADIASVGTATVAVVTAGGISSGTATFTIAPDASVTSISPVNVPAGTPGATVTITGANFTGSCVALWNNTAVNTVFVSRTQLSAWAPATLLANPGTANIVVQLKSINSNSETFTIDALPTLSALTPNSVNQGGPDLTVILTGKNYVSGSVAQWNGVDLATTFVSATSLSAVIPAADTAAAGISQISVENPDTAVTPPLPFRVLVVNNSPLWTQRLVWAHSILNFTYCYPASGSGLYDELYPLDMSSAPPSQSPATDIALAQAEGIDGLSVDIGMTGTAADPVLTAADAASPTFYVSPCLDMSTQTGDAADTTENSVVAAVKAYAYDAATHPSAARDNGNLVIWTFDSTEMPNANWKDAQSRIESAGINVTWVADFEGLYPGNTMPVLAITGYLNIFQAGYVWAGDRDAFWDQTVDLFELLGHNWCGAVRAGSISPTQYYDAQCTFMMRTRWQRNLTDVSGTQWAMASTWNDFGESTGVNPTSQWNMVRSDLTAYYAAKFKGLPAPNPNAELYVTSPEALNLNEPSTAEAMIINPTSNTVTADIQLFDGNGAQIGTDVLQSVGPNSVGAATVPIDLTSQPAGGYLRANAIMYDADDNVLQSVQGAPTIVYPAGAMPTVNVVYYSIPAYNALPGTVGLALTPNGVTGQATATLTAPAGTNVKFAEVLYNTQESEQFYASAPTTQTVSTTGPGFYVARVIDQNRHVGYSNPVYVGP